MEDARDAIQFKPKETWHDQVNRWSPKNSNFTLPKVQSSATDYTTRYQNGRNLIEVKQQDATLPVGGQYSHQ